MIKVYNDCCLRVMSGLPAGSVDAVIADPPYGIDYQSAWRTDAAKRHKKIDNDKAPFIWWIHEAARVLKPTGSLVCFCRWDVQEPFRMAIECTDLQLKSQIIWDKLSHGMGDLEGSFAPQHEVAWFAVKPLFKLPGDRPKTIIRAMRVDPSKMIHPNEKPVALLGDIVRSITKEGDVVLDPFMGSGSTGFACKQNNRGFIGIEIDEDHFKSSESRLLNCMPLFGEGAA